MLTSKPVTRVCERQGKYLFKSCDSFPNGVLPTKRDVLQRLLHERNWRTRAAAVIVANELYKRWIHCNVYCISVDGIVFRILTLVKDFRQMNFSQKKGKKDSAPVRHLIIIRRNFYVILKNSLIFFVMTKNSDENLEINKLKMNEDQEGPRKRKGVDVVEPIDQSDINSLQNMSQKNPIPIIQF